MSLASYNSQPASSPTSSSLPAPERTKTRLLELIKRHGPQTAQDLAYKLEVSVPAARRHLCDLQDGGLIESRTERPGGRGRPQHVFALTDQGEASFPKTYSGLCVDVLRHVQQLFGQGAVLQVFDARSAEIARRLQAEVPRSSPLPERVQAFVRVLCDMGFDAVAEQEGDVWLVSKRNCPNLTVARQFQELCISELTLYQELLNVPMTRETRIACGQSACLYRIGP
ncbi:helix-turn-helix transcriptional regulator [Deinococcus aquatilis]|jgi:predicted ArsR family transcriptional regulator|uniref:helix-turn-helix transcriptional regulator n=1 Tax=Deinococcus aquatilis TaxID=519440 RepID=UPI0003797EED|nr:metalloregulator ArsR/SmtB family transcription factor [Deinococcus aquatilis]